LGRISNFRTIALDLPNFGFSDRTEPTFENYVSAVEEFVEKLQLKDVVILAHSLGGAIGMKLALKRPDLVKSLILVDPCPIDGLPTPTENLPYLELYGRNRSVLRRSLYGLLRNVKDRKFVERLVDDALRMNPKAIYAHAEELGRFDLTGQTGNYCVKTLLVWGDMDPLLTREQMEKTCKALKARLVVFNNVGHTPFVEASDDFLKSIEPFLREVGT
jgi:branched-chain amino acid transport system permease protein